MVEDAGCWNVKCGRRKIRELEEGGEECRQEGGIREVFVAGGRLGREFYPDARPVVVVGVAIQDGAGINEISSAEMDKQRVLGVWTAGDLEKDVMWNHGVQGGGQLGGRRGVEPREDRPAFGDERKDLATGGPGATPRVEPALFNRAKEGSDVGGLQGESHLEVGRRGEEGPTAQSNEGTRGCGELRATGEKPAGEADATGGELIDDHDAGGVGE